MPITPFLRNQAFDAEKIEVMSAAFVKACDSLGLLDRSDQMTELVASRIIALAQRGVRNTTTLYLGVMQEFKANPQ